MVSRPQHSRGLPRSGARSGARSAAVAHLLEAARAGLCGESGGKGLSFFGVFEGFVGLLGSLAQTTYIDFLIFLGVTREHEGIKNGRIGDPTFLFWLLASSGFCCKDTSLQQGDYGPKGLKSVAANRSSTSNARSKALPVPLLLLREVQGNLTCQEPGCAANVSLQIYNPLQDCPLPEFVFVKTPCCYVDSLESSTLPRSM